MRRLIAPWIAAIVAVVGLTACVEDDKPNRGLPQTTEPVRLDHADFTTTIDNPYLPLRVGARWEYVETDTTGAREKVVVRVTDKTKRIASGVTARVVRDTATEKGVPIEITDDWYAQDKAGNVWYLGEYVTNYEDGKVVDHDGSFEAGVDGAQAGIAMPADPEPGLSYRQEYYIGNVLSAHTDGDGGRAELAAFDRGR